jgi:hypothetical protein
MIHFERGRFIEPSKLVRLINSTELGTVTTRGRLKTQQDAAGYRIGDDRKIDVWNYTAWLAGEVKKWVFRLPDPDEVADIYEQELKKSELPPEPEKEPEPEAEAPVKTESEMIEHVYRWLLEGNSTGEILLSINARFPEGNAVEILQKTQERFATFAKPSGDQMVGFIFEAQKKIYRDMLKIGDYNGALRALSAQYHFAERLGLIKQPKNKDDEGGIDGLVNEDD